MPVTPDDKQPDIALGLVVTAEAEVIKADSTGEPEDSSKE